MPKLTITHEDISQVVALIDTWQGKLTWDLLTKKITELFNIHGGVTRQSLSSKAEIKLAFQQRKEKLKEKVESVPNYSVEYLRNQVERLEAELEREKEKTARYEARFVRWQYNAYLHNAGIESLDDPVEALENEEMLEMLEKPLSALNRQHRKNK
ncbi:hypothetical protein L3Q72_13215 [Vibrio sp. JC009]|uniref:hypothetical protein n=1 Tax=Vibrio sp. JC009 TaxID=2912314 RepID=UPI0023B05932|nr:hypothetical protein [Vibrio sp. JC009]WED21572.1 hypothetical protein L3Q72_13215 [Vibrio sp. JC009]